MGEPQLQTAPPGVPAPSRLDAAVARLTRHELTAMPLNLLAEEVRRVAVEAVDADDASIELDGRPAPAHASSASGLHGGRGLCVVPLLTAEAGPGDRVLGSLTVVRAGRPFTESEAHLIRTVGALAAVRLAHRSRADAAAAVDARRRVALAVVRDLAVLDPPGIISRLLERLIDAVGAERGTVSWIDGADFVVAHSHDPDGTATPAGSRIRWAIEPWCRRSIEERRPIVAGPVVSDALSAAQLAPYSGVRHRLLFPIVVGDDVVASIAVSRRRDEPFGLDDLEAAAPLIDVAAVALRNARLYEESERARELAVEAARRAEQLEREKSAFLLLASHELRGPIAVARGYVSMLSDGSLQGAEDAGRVIPIVAAKLAQMNALVDDMLDEARLADGRLELVTGHVDLRDVVEAAVASTRQMAPDGASFAVELPDEPVPVVADERRVRAIVGNLLDNALKYSRPDGVVRCRLCAAAPEAVLEVEDTGMGIPAAMMGTLFSRFGRVVTEQTSHIPGVGLGLHLGRELARMHGGDLRLASVEGEGTTATLTLPLAP